MEFIRRILETNLADYKNLGLGEFYINQLLLGAFVGIAIVSYAFCFVRMNMNLCVRQLIRHTATSLDKACTLRELGLADSFGVKWLLKTSGQLKAVVGRVGETQLSYEEYVALDKEKRGKLDKIDFDTERFFIRDGELERAQLIAEKYRASWLNNTLLVVLLFIIFGTVMALMPDILRLIDNSLIPN